MTLYEQAIFNARLLVENLTDLEGNAHPERNFGAFAVGFFNASEPSRISIETINIGVNPYADKEVKYGFLALEKLIGNFSHWQRHRDKTALSRSPTVDKSLLRYLGSALTVIDDGRGMVSAYSGHPEGLVDEAISAITNYSVGLASEEHLRQITNMSSNIFMTPMLELYHRINTKK